MAVGKKTGGNDFKPGMTGNPNGRPKVPEDIKSARLANKIEFQRILNKLFSLDASSLNEIVKSSSAPINEKIVAKILQTAFDNADTFRLQFVLDRMGITLPKTINDDEEVDSTSLKGVKSFSEFCVDAGYPAPFEKQLEMRAFAFDLDDIRLLLGARGYGKTDYVTVLGTAYQIYLAVQMGEEAVNNETNLIITKSKSRNTAIVNEIAEALLKNGVELDKKNSTCIRVKGHLGKDHNVEAITIKTSFRGRHPKRTIMDDPVTEEDTSEAMRTLVKTKYNEAYKLSKNICIIGQPAHPFDLYAEVREIIKKMEVAHGEIPQLDADLDAMKLAGISLDSIEMSYHLRVPVSGTMPFSKIKYIDKFPSPSEGVGTCVAFIDPSDGGDHTATSAIKGYFDGVAIEGMQWKRAWFHCLDEMLVFYKKIGVKKICFETNMTGVQPIQMLQEFFGPHGIGVVGKRSDTNKHAVIMAAGGYAPLIYLSKGSEATYTDHVKKYEYGAKYDDAPDSLARGLEWIGLIKGKK